MQLTIEQKEMLKKGSAIELVVDGNPCVLIRKEVYEHQSRVPEYDDSEWTLEEMRTLAANTFADADEAGPIQ